MRNKELSLTLLAGFPLLWLAAGGCARQPALGQVSGTVLGSDHGPLEGVLVTFLPDPAAATHGLPACGVTDDSGRYQLTYGGSAEPAGVVVGWHKVVITDFAAENRRDERRARRPRVPPPYRLPSTTPLEVPVRPGQQIHDFRIDSR